MDYPIDTIREFFPVLNQQVNNRPLVYLDTAASALKPLPVLEAEKQLYHQYYGNVHRAAHYMADKATIQFEKTREKVKDFIHAETKEQIIFTKGTTESINLVATSFGEAFVQEGDEIIVSEMEHHSNLVPWQLLAMRKKAKLVQLSFNHLGELEIEELATLITHKTKLIAVTHISNVLGTINPIKEIISLAHQKNVPVLIDGAQAVPHTKIDVQDLNVDFYVFSAHKMYGPNGVGVLYGKKEWLEKMPPYHGGGEMVSTVTFEQTTYNELPYKFEAGTPNISGVIAFGAAINFLEQIGLHNVQQWEESLCKMATSELKKIDGIEIYGESLNKSGVISFNVKDIHHYDISMLLDKMGIAVRTGHHCAETVMLHYNVNGMMRISFGMYNSKNEIDTFIKALKRVISMF